jgi:hypothetical protein
VLKLEGDSRRKCVENQKERVHLAEELNMLKSSKTSTAVVFWLLIASMLFIALTSIILGWNRSWNGQSSHTYSLAIILAVILAVLAIIVYFISWRQSPDGARKFWSFILGILMGLVIIVSIGMIVLFFAVI